MAERGIELYTKDTILAATCKGNQEKWFDEAAGMWYKLDSHGFESLAEAVAGQVLALHSNICADYGLPVIQYSVEKVKVHRRERVACASKNFLGEEDSLVTAYTLLKNALGPGFAAKFNRLKTFAARMQLLVGTVEAMTGVQKFGQYLTLLFEADALTLNQDRHLNNIALLRNKTGYRPGPIFDNGEAFLLDDRLYPFDVKTNAWISQAVALPFKTSFTRSVNAMRKLYGGQLKVDFSAEDLEKIIDPLLEWYPGRLQADLKERIMEVLISQKKKLFS